MKVETHNLSYSADVRYIPPSGKKVKITATKEELVSLAERFNIPAVTAFSAEALLERGSGNQFRLTAEFEGKVIQQCGVTLENFEQDVCDKIDIVFQDERSEKEHGKEYVVDMSDAFEVIEDGKIPVAETLIEYFSLAIDPFPKKEGATFAFESDKEEKENPFAVLEKLKQNQKKD